MKKLLALLLSLILALSATALAEVVVISSPDMAMPEYDGELGNIQLGKGIDLGDRVYMPINGMQRDYFDVSGLYYVGRSETSDLLTLEMEVTNLSTLLMCDKEVIEV